MSTSAPSFTTPRKRTLSDLENSNNNNNNNTTTSTTNNNNGYAFTDHQEMINAVISTLDAPEEKTNVAITYANDKNLATEVQAYAKIAGKDWTYYVKSLAVSIGRNTDVQPNANNNTLHNSLIDIDLGPAKVVSRQHAAIVYNLDLRCWELKVSGRNGARIDGSKITINSKEPNVLQSGAILDIGGTQMMFILPDAPAIIDPKILEKCLAKYKQQLQYANHNKRPSDHNIKNFQMFDNSHLSHLTHSPSSISANSLQSNLDQDLSKEEAKDIKPPYSYATMITQAILSNPNGVMSLSEIYNWIASHYAYYKYSKTGWQNSIRHNLSLNKAFEKVPRRANEPGKGMKWQISDSYKEDFLNKISDGTISKTRRGSSVSRQLSLHLATHKQLPESQKFADQNASKITIATHDPNQHLQQSQPQQQQSYQQQIPQQTLHQQQQQPVPQYSIPANPMQANPLGYIPQNNNMYNMQNVARPYTAYQQQPIIYQQAPAGQQQQHQQQQSFQQQSQPQSQPSQTKIKAEPHQVKQESYTANGVKQEPASPPDSKQPSQSVTPKVPKVNVTRGEHSRNASFTNNQLQEMSQSQFNSTANESTSTAPTTNGDIGLNFASPKKITALEAYTPERGSRGGNGTSNHNNPNNNGKPNNQSSPAFWNFVQFSTPNGQQSPLRKNGEGDDNDDEDDEEGEESNSPTLNRKRVNSGGKSNQDEDEDEDDDEDDSSPFTKDQQNNTNSASTTTTTV